MANIITVIRIMCGLGLLFCPTFSTSFYTVYLVGGLSDVLDGAVARLMRQETELGARLDTAADTIFTGVVLLKLLREVFFLRWILLWIGAVAFIKCVNFVSSFLVSGHFISEHTFMNKLCGVLLFAVPLCIRNFPWQPVALLLILTCAAATCAALQEGYYILSGIEIR